MERRQEGCIQDHRLLAVDTRPEAVAVRFHFVAPQNNLDCRCRSTSGFEEPHTLEVAVGCYRRNMAVVRCTAPVHDLRESFQLPSLYHEKEHLQRGGVDAQ